MEWRDTGIVLSVRGHGESSAIVELLTAEHGRHAGVVRGGQSRRMTPILQPGEQLAVTWRARLEDHLGSFTIEPIKSRAAQVMGDRAALAGLNAVTALLCYALPERESHPTLYHQTMAILDMLGGTALWPLAYLRWEMTLLDELGFGLDLSQCAVTGAVENLIYVSPRTGRAVSAKGAGEWADRLFPLPAEMLGKGDGSQENVLAGLRITGHFLTTGLAHALGDKPLPEARGRLIHRLEKMQ